MAVLGTLIAPIGNPTWNALSCTALQMMSVTETSVGHFPQHMWMIWYCNVPPDQERVSTKKDEETY